MKRCLRCTLPATFPGAALDSRGLCHYCRQAEAPVQDLARGREIARRFEELAARVRGRQAYDCLVSWSGGKDSTYVLTMVKEEYGLRPLALTLDNGFVSPRALDNCRVVADKLGVDHMIFAPRFDLLRRLFSASLDGRHFPRAALRRASGICNACMGLNKLIAVQIAQEKRIPILIYGWSPGQIPLPSALLTYTPSLVQTMLQSTATLLRQLSGEDLSPYLPAVLGSTASPIELHSASPLVFVEYDEAHIRERIAPLGWKAPEDTDPNSSNCLLNTFASMVHRQQFGYHPYDMELATLVRRGDMTREQALRRLEAPPDLALSASIAARLGISEEQLLAIRNSMPGDVTWDEPAALIPELSMEG